MKFKEKAKTSYAICEKAYLTCEACKHQGKCGSGGCPLANVLWVRLEDAQKQVDELKQKLQRLINELKLRPSELGTLYSTYQEGWLDAMVLAIRKFEELLQEAKP